MKHGWDKTWSKFGDHLVRDHWDGKGRNNWRIELVKGAYIEYAVTSYTWRRGDSVTPIDGPRVMGMRSKRAAFKAIVGALRLNGHCVSPVGHK